MLIVAEAFGAIAVVLNFIGYRQNRVERYLFISAFALLSLSVHFFMLDAMAAGVGTCLAGLRNFIAIKNRSRWVLFVFVAANILFMLYEWFILHHDWNIFIAYASSLIPHFYDRLNCLKGNRQNKTILFARRNTWAYVRPLGR